MARSIVTGLLVLCLAASAPAWVATIPGQGDDDTEARGVAVDANGDVYASGTILSGGEGAIGAAKFAGATGSRLWKTPALPGVGYGVVLQVGNPVVVGMREVDGFPGGDAGSAVLDPANGAVLGTSVVHGSGSEYWFALATGALPYVAKGGSLTPSGSNTRQFAVQLGGWPVAYVAPFELNGLAGPGIAFDVVVDGNGNAIAAGITDELILHPSNNVVSGRRHLLVAKILAADGSIAWTHVVDEVSQGTAVAVDANDDVLVGGAIASAPELTQPDDLLVLKLAGTDGTEQWRRAIDGGANSAGDVAMDVKADAAGDVIVTGRVAISPNDPLFFGGLAELAVLKLRGAEGSDVWTYVAPNTTLVATTIFGGAKGEGRAITFDTDGDPVVAGVTNASWFDAGPSGNVADFTVVKLAAATGAQRWLYVAASGGANAIATAPDGIVVAGRLNREEGDGTTVRDFAVVKLSEGLTGTSVALLDGDEPSRRRLKVKSKDRRLTSPLADRYGDPRWDGGKLVLVDPATGAEQAIELPAANWRVRGAGYEYKALSGACRLVRVDDKRGINAKCQGQEVHLPPTGATRGELAIRLELGPPQAARYCMKFGGKVTRDDGVLYKAKGAPAPRGCAGS